RHRHRTGGAGHEDARLRVNADAAGQRRQQLVDDLLARGAFRSPAVAEAMRRVPRHGFLESFVGRDPDGSWHTSPFDADDPAHLDLAYADDAVGTKMSGNLATSSMTQPGLVRQMLDPLALHPAMRLLE